MAIDTRRKKALTLNQMINFWTAPNSKHLQTTTLKVAKMMDFVLDSVEIVGKRQNACYGHFLLLSQCFQKASFSGSLKFQIV